MFTRGRLAIAAVALGLLAMLPGSAAAQYFGQNKVQWRQYQWRSIQSDHFEVFFDAGQDSLAMRVLDLSEKTNARFEVALGHTLSKRIPIVLFASHNDFAQTNITSELIEGSTGGFTEPLRDRVVIPFTGSYEDLRHVLVHELVHAFQFDILFNRPGASLLSGQGLFQLPLWFAEGMAEYYSLGGMEPNADMFCRDGTIGNYLPPLDWAGGYLVYKLGQSALTYLHERFGEQRFRDLLKRTRQMRNFSRAFQRTYGLSVETFDEQFHEALRKRYWPDFARHEAPEKYGRRLTDHRRDASNANLSPAISPDGDRIAYLSDRKQYTDVFVMSALDGKSQHRVIRGERNVMFESIPSLRSQLTWSGDGTRLALVAKSAGYDRLYVVDATRGEVLRRLDLGCPALAFPAWSPTGDSIAVVGVRDGRADLYLVELAGGQARRLTDDTWDEKEPTWSPDGRRITFSSDRSVPVVLQPDHHGAEYAHYALYDLDVASGSIRQVLDTAGEDHGPAWSPDGRKLAFLSDRSGISNLYLFDPEDGTVTQLTDVLGGIESVSWSRRNDRLVFAAFDRFGYDVFAVQQPLGNESVFQKLRRDSPEAVLTLAAAALPPAIDSTRARRFGALATLWPDSLSRPDSTGGPARRPRPDRSPLEPVAAEPPAWDGERVSLDPRRGAPEFVPPDTATAGPLPVRTPLAERGGPFALGDSVLSQAPTEYKWRLSPEYFSGGFIAASGYGVVGLSQLLFSDFLGDRQLIVSTDVFSNSLSESNAIVYFNYLPRRWDVGGGLFHFKNYYSSHVTTLGEALSSSQLFSERSFGGLVSFQYPFDRFRRMDLEFTQMFVQRDFFAEDAFGLLYKVDTQYRSITSPSVSLVGDNALFGGYGPVNGGRYNLGYSPSFSWFDNGLAYHTLTADVRRYWDLTGGYSLAFRTLNGVSLGRDPQTFQVGGFSTLRGFPNFDLRGTRVNLVNTELRFPFIQQLGLVGPVPLGNFNLKGAVFSDMGVVYREGDHLRFWRPEGGRHLDSPYLSFGAGIRSWFLIGLMKLDVAWPTDLQRTGKPRWHFSIGPEF